MDEGYELNRLRQPPINYPPPPWSPEQHSGKSAYEASRARASTAAALLGAQPTHYSPQHLQNDIYSSFDKHATLHYHSQQNDRVNSAHYSNHNLYAPHPPFHLQGPISASPVNSSTSTYFTPGHNTPFHNMHPPTLPSSHASLHEETNPTRIWTRSDFRALLAELKNLDLHPDRPDTETPPPPDRHYPGEQREKEKQKLLTNPFTGTLHTGLTLPRGGRHPPTEDQVLQAPIYPPQPPTKRFRLRIGRGIVWGQASNTPQQAHHDDDLCEGQSGENAPAHPQARDQRVIIVRRRRDSATAFIRPRHQIPHAEESIELSVLTPPPTSPATPTTPFGMSEVQQGRQHGSRVVEAASASFPKSYATAKREAVGALLSLPREVREEAGFRGTVRWVGKGRGR